ncbi:MAG: DUF5652 family protein [Candidatus Beckwithbacteria bacterium]|nr:DUF5652 family protein [Candidatus Beckwithbacteria bacterium]
MHYIFPPFFYNQSFLPSFFTWLLFPLLAWHLVWKGLALWKAGRNNQRGWFIVLLIVNTLGLLEIIYLCCFQKKTVSAKGRH